MWIVTFPKELTPVIETIYKRRSTRHYIKKNIPPDVLESILTAGIQAPSEKNQQPWRFVVVQGPERRSVIRCMKEGIRKNRAGEGIFSKYPQFIPSAVYTTRVLEQAPCLIFALNALGYDLAYEKDTAEALKESSDIQSVAAAMENVALAATKFGVGSLWTCDIYFAYHELKEWLGVEGEPVAAMALGYTDKEIPPTPRKPLSEVVFYKGTPEGE